MNYMTSFFVAGALFLAPVFAFAATLTLTPQVGTYKIGDTFSVTVHLNTEGEDILGVDLEMTFPPSLLEVPGGRITGGTLMQMEQLNRIEGNKIRFAQIMPALTSFSNSSPELFAIIPFRVIGSGVAPLTILHAPENTRDSNVAKLGGIDLLRGVENALFTLLTADGRLLSQGSSYAFSRDLRVGSTGADVKELQKFLNARGFALAQSGPGSSGNETEYFGPITRAAMIRFQEAYTAEILTPVGLSRGTGYFGLSTRAKANGLLSLTLPPQASPVAQNRIAELQDQIRQAQEQVNILLQQLQALQ